MIVVPAGVKVHLALGYTDMRKGLDGLATLIQEHLKKDPFSGHLFVFRGKKPRRLTEYKTPRVYALVWSRRPAHAGRPRRRKRRGSPPLQLCGARRQRKHPKEQRSGEATPHNPALRTIRFMRCAA
jgi:hypothetical protein